VPSGRAAEVKRISPEFVNRIDEIVVFHALDELISIDRENSDRLPSKASCKNGHQARGRDAALAHIAKAGFDPVSAHGR
jgi:ATP-dependent Clp protease ATP-binding subunit ClpB